MPVNDMVIRIGGESGEGIVTIGEIFVRIAAFSGLEVYTFRTFPAEILGGHVTFQARIADKPVLSQGDDIDVLVSLNQEGYDNHIDELRPGGVVLYDGKSVTPTGGDDSYSMYDIPVDELARSIDFVRGRDLVMIGAMVQLFGLPLDKAEQMVHRRLGRFKALLPKNLESLNLGYGYAQETNVSQYTEGTFNIDLVDARKKKLVWEAVGTGRVSQKALEELEERVNAGVANFFAKYPFTAGSNVPVTTEK